MRKIISIAVLPALLMFAGFAPGQTGRNPFAKQEKPKGSPSANGFSTTGQSTDPGCIRCHQAATGSSTPAQPAKSGLEKALDEALKHNPDLRVAAAKASEAEAVLTRARLQVTQKVVASYQSVELSKTAVKIATDHLQRLRELFKKGAQDQTQVTTAEQDLAAAKARLAAAEADLNYLLGKSGHPRYRLTTVPMTPLGTWLERARPLEMYYHRPSTSDTRNLPPSLPLVVAEDKSVSANKMRKTLDKRISLKLNETSARDVLKMILKESGGMHIQAVTRDAPWDEKITAELKDVPLGAALQLLEDTLTGSRIAVRSYGLLIASEGSIPRGAVLLADFWPSSVKSETKPPSKK